MPLICLSEAFDRLSRRDIVLVEAHVMQTNTRRWHSTRSSATPTWIRASCFGKSSSRAAEQ